jgi:MFS family permease
VAPPTASPAPITTPATGKDAAAGTDTAAGADAGPAFRAGTLAGVVETLAAAMTWTGLPFYAVTVTNRSGLFTWLFTAQTIAGIGATAIAGTITDRFPLRRVVLATSTVTAAGLLTIGGSLSAGRIWPFLALSLAIQLSGTIAANTVKVWFTFLAPQGELARWIARRETYLIVAKLAGTSAGPLLYQVLGRKALLLNALMVLAAAAGYVIAARRAPAGRPAPERDEPFRHQVADGFRVVRGRPALARLVLLQSCAGLLGLPLTAVALRLLKGMPGAGPLDFSLFWIIGFAGAFGTNMAVGKGRLRIGDPLRMITTTLLTASAAIAVLADIGSPLLFAGGFLVVVVSRTTLNVVLFASIVPSVAATHRGRIVGLTDLVNDGAGLLALAVFLVVPDSALPVVTTGYVLAVALGSLLLTGAARRGSAEPETTAGV